MSKLLVEKMYKDSKIPVKANPTDAGYDVCAYDVKRIYIHSGGNSEGVLEITDDMSAQLEARVRDRLEDNVLSLQCNERALIGTGLKVTVENGWEIQVRARSGVVLKQGLIVGNSPGTVDASYRGELGVLIINTSRQVQTIKLGDRIAQIIPKKVENLEIEVVETLPDVSERGTGGFGSTGLGDKK